MNFELNVFLLIDIILQNISISVLVSLITMFFMVVILVLLRSLLKTSAETFAVEITKCRWYVKAILLVDKNGAQEGTISLVLSSTYLKNSARDMCKISFGPDYPSVDRLRSLAYLEIVGFELLGRPLEGTYGLNPCDYLALKV
jgi:hypothetical protein